MKHRKEECQEGQSECSVKRAALREMIFLLWRMESCSEKWRRECACISSHTSQIDREKRTFYNPFTIKI